MCKYLLYFKNETFPVKKKKSIPTSKMGGENPKLEEFVQKLHISSPVREMVKRQGTGLQNEL